METNFNVTDNEFLRQFESVIEGELVKIEYAQQERKVFLTKLVMSDSLRQEGHVEEFISEVLELLKDRNTRVMPTSPEIAGFMRKNRRKYRDLLPVGINI